MKGVSIFGSEQESVGTQVLLGFRDVVRIPGEGEKDSGVNAKGIPG